MRLRDHWRHPVLQRLLMLASGTAAGQIMMIAVLPVVTRLYDPSDFGLLGAFSSTIMIVLPAACMRFDLAIPIPADDDDARGLAVLSFLSASAVSFLLFMGTLVFAHNLNGVLGILAKDFGWLIAITLWFAAIFSMTQYWAIRHQRYRTLVVAHMSRGLLGAGSQVGLGIAGAGSIGLLLGQAIYIGFGASALVVEFLLSEFRHIRRVSVTCLKETARRNWRFPVFSVPGTLLNSAAVYLPMLLIVSLVGVKAGGVLYIAQRVTNIPVALIGGNLSHVYLGEAPIRYRNGTLFSFTTRLIGFLFAVGLVPAVLAVVIAPWLVGFAFGKDWGASADMIALLIPAAFFQFCAVPASTIFQVKSMQLVALILQGAGLVWLVGPIVLFYWTGLGNPIIGYAIGAAIHYAVYIIAILIAARD